LTPYRCATCESGNRSAESETVIVFATSYPFLSVRKTDSTDSAALRSSSI
jgi:hypothetical protein